jgi:integrase
MRLSEVRTLRREHVYLDQGVVLLPQTQTEPRPVILSGAAQKILRGQLEGHASPWVFPNADGRPFSRGHVSKRFRQAARSAALGIFTFMISATTGPPWR